MKFTVVGSVALSLLMPTVVFAGVTPIGTFDAVDNATCTISGWVKDPDTTNSISVDIYKDAGFSAGGTLVTRTTANILRADLPYVDQNHGFTYKFDPSSGLYDGKDHQIYVYSVDATGDPNIPLNLSPKLINCPKAAATASPAGTFDAVYNTSCTIAGWARDPDVIRPIVVAIFRDGEYGAGGSLVTYARADQSRLDLPFSDKNHGFSYQFLPNSGLYDGRNHRLYIYGVDATGDSNALLNLNGKTINCSPNVEYPYPSISSGESYTIGAWYFTFWSSSSNTFQLDQSQQIYGRRDAWAGIRDCHSGHDARGVTIDCRGREPLLGYYDLMDQNIMDAHIQQAASRGLSYFAFYWYWDTDTNKELSASTAIHTFMSSSKKSLMKFVLAPIMDGKKPLTLDMWKNSVVPFMVSNYINDRSILKTTDGRPVIFIWGNYFTDPATDNEAIAFLREAVRAKTQKDPLLLKTFSVPENLPATSADMQNDVTNRGEDGSSCFGVEVTAPGETYAAVNARLQSFLQLLTGGYFHATCATSAFDPRPWWHIGEGWGASPNEMPYIQDSTLDAFKQSLGQLKSYLDSHANETGRMITLYAWNEWGEGGYIEPNEFGYNYLDAIQSIFGLTPRSPAPSLTPARPTSPAAEVGSGDGASARSSSSSDGGGNTSGGSGGNTSGTGGGATAAVSSSGGGGGAGGSFVPVTTTVSSTTQTTAQKIAALLAQIAQLQALIAQLTGKSTSSSGPTYATPPSAPLSSGNLSCPTITRWLSRGSKGDDVTALQKFLNTQYENFTTDYITGFFGPTTEAALKQWQSEHHLVSSGTPNTTGYGATGPKTRAEIANACK